MARIYQAGDPEPASECVILLESGHVVQRIRGRWRCGNITVDWPDLLAGDMVAVGVDLPPHPDPWAVPPTLLREPTIVHQAPPRIVDVELPS